MFFVECEGSFVNIFDVIWICRDLFSNKMNGSILVEFSNLLDFREIDLENNLFIGIILLVLGNLIGLVIFNVFYNYLFGIILRDRFLV